MRLHLRTHLTCTADAFRVQAELTAYEGDETVRTRTWDETIPRDHV